jgi:hypothetical protein
LFFPFSEAGVKDGLSLVLSFFRGEEVVEALSYPLPFKGRVREGMGLQENYSHQEEKLD